MAKKNNNFKEFFFSDTDQIGKKEFLSALKLAVEEAGSLEALGNKIGFPKSTLSEVLNGKREPSERMLQQLGIRRVELFEPLAAK